MLLETNFTMILCTKIVLVVPFTSRSFAVLVVLVAIRKSQLVVHKNFSKKPRVKMLMKLTPGDKNWQLIYPK